MGKSFESRPSSHEESKEDRNLLTYLAEVIRGVKSDLKDLATEVSENVAEKKKNGESFASIALTFVNAFLEYFSVDEEGDENKKDQNDPNKSHPQSSPNHPQQEPPMSLEYEHRQSRDPDYPEDHDQEELDSDVEEDDEDEIIIIEDEEVNDDIKNSYQRPDNKSNIEINEKNDPKFVVENDTLPGVKQYIEEMPKEGKLWAGRLPGNGGETVVTYMPPGFNHSKPAQIVYQFPGTYSYHVEKNATGYGKKVGWKRLGDALGSGKEMQQYRNTIIVYVLSRGPFMRPDATKKKHYDQRQMATGKKGVSKVGSDKTETVTANMDDLHQQVLGKLANNFNYDVSQINNVIAKGHSAGGLTLANIAGSNCKSVDAFVFEDASYAWWAQRCWQNNKKFGNNAKIMLAIVENSGPKDSPANWCKYGGGRGTEWCNNVTKRGRGYETGIPGVYAVYLSEPNMKHKDLPRNFLPWLHKQKEKPPDWV